MLRYLYRDWAWRLFATALLAATTATRADDGPPALPDWQALEFVQEAFLVTARSKLELESLAQSLEMWQLTATSSIKDNSENVIVRLDPASGQAHSRTRLSQGNNRRYKSWEFFTDHATRVRREPGDRGDMDPSEWPVSSELEVPYPPESEGLVITDSYVLLILAARLLDGAGEPLEVVAYTDFNFYRVGMTRSPGPAVDVDYEVAGGRQVKGRVETVAVKLTSSPLAKLADKPDFSILGLEGDVTVLFDRATGVPVQLSGDAPRIGSAQINLRYLTPRLKGT